MGVAVMEIDVNVIVSFCECLFVNNCSVSSFVLYNMSYFLLDHP